MAILDLQLPWHWVWVLHMGSSYAVMMLHREMWTRKIQHWSTTTGRFMTASIIPLQIIVVAQLFIYLSSPLMIDPPSLKRFQYAPDLIPAAISVASENYVSTMATPSDSPDLLPTDDPNTLHVLNKDVPLKGRFYIGYCCSKHGRIRCYKKTRLYCSIWSDNNNKFYYCHGFSRSIS